MSVIQSANHHRKLLVKRFKNKCFPQLIAYRNLSNKVKYGKLAPVFNEIIYIDPLKVNYKAKSVLKYSNTDSAIVINYTWTQDELVPINKVEKIWYCLEHWGKGIPWEDTGVYDRMLREIEKRGTVQSCKTIDDVVERYENLDRIFEQVKREGRLRTQEEIDRERSWINNESVIHLGLGGEPIKGKHGNHRFAMACVLGIPFPAKVGLVHVSAIPSLKILRNKEVSR